MSRGFNIKKLPLWAIINLLGNVNFLFSKYLLIKLNDDAKFIQFIKGKNFTIYSNFFSGFLFHGL